MDTAGRRFRYASSTGSFASMRINTLDGDSIKPRLNGLRVNPAAKQSAFPWMPRFSGSYSLIFAGYRTCMLWNHIGLGFQPSRACAVPSFRS